MFFNCCNFKIFGFFSIESFDKENIVYNGLGMSDRIVLEILKISLFDCFSLKDACCKSFKLLFRDLSWSAVSVIYI